MFGLNLTYATLAATLKYPNYGTKDKHGYIGVHKHGVFYTEKDALDEIITEVDGSRAEAYINLINI